MIYRVLWTVAVLVSDPCPGFKANSYTGQFTDTHCAVLHGHYESKEQQKDFSSRAEAVEFIKGAPAGGLVFQLQEIRDVPLDRGEE